MSMKVKMSRVSCAARLRGALICEFILSSPHGLFHHDYVVAEWREHSAQFSAHSHTSAHFRCESCAREWTPRPHLKSRTVRQCVNGPPPPAHRGTTHRA